MDAPIEVPTTPAPVPPAVVGHSGASAPSATPAASAPVATPGPKTPKGFPVGILIATLILAGVAGYLLLRKDE